MYPSWDVLGNTCFCSGLVRYFLYIKVVGKPGISSLRRLGWLVGWGVPVASSSGERGATRGYSVSSDISTWCTPVRFGDNWYMLHWYLRVQYFYSLPQVIYQHGVPRCASATIGTWSVLEGTISFLCLKWYINTVYPTALRRQLVHGVYL